MKTIHVDLDEIEGSVGGQLEATGLLGPARNLLQTMGRTLGQVDEKYRGMIAVLIEKTVGDWPRKEAEAWSKLLDWPWEDILLANCNYDLFMAGGIQPHLCSVLVLPTGDGPMFARNLDWDPRDQLAAASCRLEYSRGGRKLFQAAGWPGSIGAVTGVSEKGFAIALNFPCDHGGQLDPMGQPVLLLIRSLLEQSGSFRSAVETLCGVRTTSPGIFTLAGADNAEMKVVEHEVERVHVRSANIPSGGVCARLAATNHFGGDRGYCDRYERLKNQSFPGHDAGIVISDEDAFAALESVKLGITASHVVMRPRLKRLNMRAPK